MDLVTRKFDLPPEYLPFNGPIYTDAQMIFMFGLCPKTLKYWRDDLGLNSITIVKKTVYWRCDVEEFMLRHIRYKIDLDKEKKKYDDEQESGEGDG